MAFGVSVVTSLIFAACATGGSDGAATPAASDGANAAANNGTANDGGDRADAKAATDGGKEDAPDATSPTDKKRIFATKAQHSGNLGGLDGADGICAQAASDAKLGGAWIAWLSDGTTTAANRVAKVGPWTLLDGTTVFAGKAIGGIPLHDLDMDEYGTTGNKGLVWTGSKSSGASTGSHCGNWLSTGQDGTTGLAGTPDSWSNDGAPSPCSLNGRLYCVEQ